MKWESPATLLCNRTRPFDGTLAECLEHWEALVGPRRAQAVMTVHLNLGGRRSIPNKQLSKLLERYRMGLPVDADDS